MRAVERWLQLITIEDMNINRQDKGEARYDFKNYVTDGIVRPRQTSKAHSARQKTVVEAQVRLEGTLKKYGWSVTDLNETKYDLKAMIGGSSTDIKEALGAKNEK
jgi:hypothetical protein